MAITFGTFVDRQNLDNFDGTIASVQADLIDTNLSDAVDQGKEIQQEIVEMENAEQVIQQMEQVASNNAVNIAAAQNQPAPEAITDAEGQAIAPIQPDAQPVVDQSTPPAELNNMAANTVTAVENLMGRIKLKHSTFSSSLNIRSMPSTESLVRNHANGLANLIVAQEGIADTIKSMYKSVKEYIMNILRKIREWLAKYIPFFRNTREKGKALKEAAKAMKRPVLKNPDKEFEPTDKFIVVKFAIKDFNKMKQASHTIGNKMVSFLKNGGTEAKNAWEQLKKDSNLQAKSILSDDSKAEFSIVPVVEQDRSYALTEIAMGTLSDNLTFPGLILDESVDYHSGDDEYNYKAEFNVKTLKISVKTKDAKTKFKLSATEFRDFAVKMGEEIENSWKVVNDLEKLNGEMDKARRDLEKALDKSEENAKNSLNSKTISQKDYEEGTKRIASKSDLMSSARAVMQAIMTAGTYPKLLLSVGNEALDQIKDDN